MLNRPSRNHLEEPAAEVIMPPKSSATYMFWHSAKRPLRQSDRSVCNVFNLLQNPRASTGKYQSRGTMTWPKSRHPESRGRRGQTPLHWAAEKGHVSVVELLMTSGASVEAEDAFGRDPRAAATKLWDLMWILTSCLCNVNPGWD